MAAAIPARALTPADCDPYIETWWGSTDAQDPTDGGCELKPGYSLSAVPGGWDLTVGETPNGVRATSAVVPASYHGKPVVAASIWSIRSVDLSHASSLKTLQVDNEADDNSDGKPDLGWAASLDLSGAPNLTELTITAPNLDALNLAPTTQLRVLDLLRTAVTSLDLTGQTQLTDLSLGDVPLPKLDLTRQGKLANLWLSNLPLTELDLSANVALKSLGVMKTNLTSLSGSLEHLKKLNQLQLAQNRIKTLDLSKNTALVSVGVAEAGLTAINLSKNKSLKSLLMEDFDQDADEPVYSTSLKKLDVSKNTNLNELVVEGMEKLEKLDVSKLKKLLDLQFQRVPGLKVTVSKASNPRLELVTYSPKSLKSEKCEYGPRYAKWKKKTFVNART